MNRALFALVFAACGKKPLPEPARAQVSDTVKAAMDLAADPCVDFYQYACGGWVKATPLPADKPAWTRSFSEIDKTNEELIKGIVEAAAKDSKAKDADWERIGNYYSACMNEPAIEAAGITALQPWLAKIDAVDTPEELARVVGELNTVGANPLFGAWVDPDFKNPQVNIFYVNQGGLGLPDRDYYSKTDEKSLALLKAYEGHILRLLGLSGMDKNAAVNAARDIIAFETAYAALQMPVEETRDPVKTYNKINLGGLQGQIPGFLWSAWLEGMGAGATRDISVDRVSTFTGLTDLLAKTPWPTVQAYLRWNLLRAMAPSLGKAFVDANFDFYGKQVRGQQQIEDRWKRCVGATDNAFGEIIGKFYVEQRFPGDSKEKAQAMVKGIQTSFEQGLPALTWMDETTRARALEKKAAVSNMIGYPDQWRDYSKLSTRPTDHLGNVLMTTQAEVARQLAKIGKPADPTEWLMSPATVNAYYHPLYNQMVFPAGILQPPFFDRSYPSAMNYGGMGMVVGHELTHGFDDQGRQFNAKGQLTEWWDPAATARFTERAQCVSDQYSAYEVQPGLKVNGDLTLGENIADLGGVRLSYRAWKNQGGGAGEPGVEGLSHDQLFFVAFAQSWCSVYSPEFEKMLVMSNPHSPPKQRVNGPLVNLPEFHQAFACPAGKPMRPEKQCEVW